MTNARFGSAAEVISGVLYVAGGNGGSGDTPTLQGYNQGLGTWSQLTSMLGGRYTGDGAGVINSELYVPGGWTTSPGLPNSNLFIYTPSSNVWRSGASMPTLSGCGGNGVINNKLYVTTACDGSSSGSGYRNFLHVYDPTTNGWTALTASVNAHSGPATGVIGGKLYVAGGFNGSAYSTSTSLEVYDPVAGTWTTRAPMTAGREGASGAVVNGKLYVFGGTNAPATTLNTVEVYDPVANTWTTLASMPTSRSYTGIGVINGIIYVVGGSNGSGPLTTLEAYRP
jgi:N-acetylneuraminic acid mutarotase